MLFYMANSNLKLNIRPKTRGRRVVVEIDADRFERLAADLGFFGKEFLASIGRAEREISGRKLNRLQGLRGLRSR